MWCISAKREKGRVAEWPPLRRELYRTLSRRGKLENFKTKEAAESAIPSSLRGWVHVCEYCNF